MKAIWHLVVLAACLGLVGSATADTAPHSMAALGDSITRGYNACQKNEDCLDMSWATGNNWVANSHYLRIRTRDWRMTAHRFNNAKNGVKVADLNRQAGLAVDQGAQYVTILIGTNDACAASMTPASTFENQFANALATLHNQAVPPRILVASIPDWHHVWTIAHDDWPLGMCPSLSGAPDAPARLAVRDRIIDYNNRMAAVCAQYPATCRFDGNAVFDHPFLATELSEHDAFHPNAFGEARLATWSNVYAFEINAEQKAMPIVDVEVHYHPGTSRKIDQISGNLDRPLQKDTPTLTGEYHLNGTDLGTTFEHEGRLYLFFGDTQGGTSAARDSFAYTTDLDPWDLDVTIPTMPSDPTRFQPLDVPGVPNGAFCVPTGAISHDGLIYMVYATDWNVADHTMTRSVMVTSDDDGMTWSEPHFDVSAADPDRKLADAHFINASLTIENLSNVPGLANGEYLLLFGSGFYRQSSVYLAVVPTDEILTPGAMKYFAGLVGGAPTWSANQAEAAPMIDEEYTGELSVRWIPELGKWVLLYNSPGAFFGGSGIVMRTADVPWGPFSSREVIFDHLRDDGAAHFVHVECDPDDDDAIDPCNPTCPFECDDFGEGTDGGGVYGPYLMPRYTTSTATGTQLYYTMSTWNPYDVVVMRSEVGAAPLAENPVSTTETLTLGDSSWSKTSGTWFSAVTFANGATGVQTGVAEKGVMSRWLPRDQWNRSLSFQVTGGNAEVLLLEGAEGLPPTTPITQSLYDDIKEGLYGRVVQATWGHKNAHEVPVVWDLRPFARGNLKVVVIDHRTGAPWGYVKASHMTLARNAPPIGTPQCGDSVHHPGNGEECDDGNLLDGDGCDSNCKHTRCGNGIETAGEQCDDGNTLPNDCCSPACQYEAATTVCRVSTGVCDPQESCSGISETCPANAFSPNGTPCTDANACTLNDACANGLCVGTCNTGAACSGACGGTCRTSPCTCQ